MLIGSSELRYPNTRSAEYRWRHVLTLKGYRTIVVARKRLPLVPNEDLNGTLFLSSLGHMGLLLNLSSVQVNSEWILRLE